MGEGQSGLFFAGWDSQQETLAQFQQRFNPQIRHHIGGEIRFYAIYKSGATQVISYFEDKIPEVHDAPVLRAITVIAESLRRISEQSRQIEEAFLYTLDALARASEANDEDTGAHILRLNEYSYALAVEMGLERNFCRTIRYSAMMHDVGKIHIHPDILKKPGRLTEQEFHIMQAHPIYGAKILGDSPQMAMAAEIARYHHEKYHGGGYPFGLKGEAIPLSARIVALADVYDALRQKRVYKPAFSHAKAVDIIVNGDGRTEPEHFDPEVLAAFKRIHNQMDDIFSTLQDRDKDRDEEGEPSDD
ncbi:HD domain-containing protein [Ectothiorhodospiraceae bacterium BW-2]|nr:HD domain-containing protein [Ectothiorhodospiraceae bacterium BW-2]